ncbi:CRISPR-associated helicase Cas3' [Endobacter medicaginis]|uniref:CRISPR-associated helicase Cas3' n=1 Tax=Endobacter medicaginis TaxID=1181271 RepID=UPI00210BC446|nr:CRISPR-associated helicase Cas3' [Endobacter medicaginis]MCX5476010.1 CRISPR-associated helicase Cas3' [Endobacter medicaginis]
MLDASDLAAFWGKAQPHEGADSPLHPLLAHSLDVAAVAMALPAAARLGLPLSTIGFWVALHDIGKLCGAFQGKVPEHWPGTILGPCVTVAAAPHDALGLYLLSQMIDRLAPAIGPTPKGRRLWIGPRIPQAVAGHHGRPAVELPAITRLQIEPGARAAAARFVDLMLSLFDPEPLPYPGSERAVARLGWQLAGLTILADWIGSRQGWFPYVKPQDVADPAAYLRERAIPQARRAIEAASLGIAAPRRFEGVGALFPAISIPTPVQLWAETVALPPGPVLAVIEDLTGSGKTEAALTLAHRLLVGGQGSGLFVALPTMATANAMYGRLAEAYRRLFADNANPSLVLAHGRAGLDARFAATIAPDDADHGRAPDEPADEPAEAHCAAWLADDSRRALLADIGVGTIDQALFSVLPVRHAALRQQGLAGKILIIDEAHAFDAYMHRELRALLEFHAALGGSAILLSATLPLATRQELVDSFRKGLGQAKAPLGATDYPLATLAGPAAIVETRCDPRPGLSRSVAVCEISEPDVMIERIARAHAGGQAVAWVRNTVDDAIAAHAACTARGLVPLLFHARFAMADRLAIEAEVLRRFGKDGTPAERPGVLIATQVIEQSLDLDFDLLCSDLAPVDLLIQRAGRLWRHRRDRPHDARCEMLLLSPPPVAEPDIDWLRRLLPGTEAVYRDPALLWRTARALFARGAITTPDDMRPLIETAYDRDGPAQVPEALRLAAERAEGEARAASGIAAQNVLRFDHGYARDAGLWERDDRTPTRIEREEHVTLRLARRNGDSIVPYVEDPDPRRAWAMSEIGVARRLIEACPVPAGLDAAARQARAGWGRWERESDRYLLAIVEREGDAFAFTSTPRGGKPRISRYSPVIGLEPAAPSA